MSGCSEAQYLAEQWTIFRSVLVLRDRMARMRQARQKLTFHLGWRALCSDVVRVSRFRSLKTRQIEWKLFSRWAAKSSAKAQRRRRYLEFVMRCLSKFRVLVLKESKRCFVRRRWRHMVIKLRNAPVASVIAEASTLRFNLAIPALVQVRKLRIEAKDAPKRAVEEGFKVDLVQKKSAAVRRVQSMRRTRKVEFDDILSERFMDIFFKPNMLFRAVENTCECLRRVTKKKYNARYNMPEEENGAFLSDFASGIVAAAVWNVFGSALAVTDMRPQAPPEVRKHEPPPEDNGISFVYGDNAEEIQSATIASEIWDEFDKDLVQGDAFYGDKTHEDESTPATVRSTRSPKNSPTIAKSGRSAQSPRDQVDSTQAAPPPSSPSSRKQPGALRELLDEQDDDPETNLTEEEWDQAFRQASERRQRNTLNRKGSSSGYQQSSENGIDDDSPERQTNEQESEGNESPELVAKRKRPVRAFISDSDEEVERPKKERRLVKPKKSPSPRRDVAWPESDTPDGGTKSDEPELETPIEFSPRRHKYPREVTPIIAYKLPSGFSQFASDWLDDSICNMVTETAFHVVWRSYVRKSRRKSMSPNRLSRSFT